MRIATWNLEGKWTPRHHWLIRSLRADLLLLTEALDKVEIPGFNIHFTEGEMQPGRRWAAIATNAPLRPLPDPHGATALAEVEGFRAASSILPWRNGGGAPPWNGEDQGIDRRIAPPPARCPQHRPRRHTRLLERRLSRARQRDCRRRRTFRP